MGSVYERASHGDVVFWVEHAFYFRSGDSEERTCPGICNTMDTCMCNTALSASIAHTMVCVVEVDRDPIVEMCLTIDGYNTGRTSPTVRSNVGCFSGQSIEDLSS